MSIEAIKKALEGVKPDRLRYEADAMYAAVQGEEYGDTFHAFNWADKPHRVLYDAINLIRDSASEIDRLQRENAELRNLADRFKLEAQGRAMEARTANSTIYEIYQIVTGAKGEPGNWRGAEPVRKYVSQLMIDASNHAADAETVRREREVERRRAEAAEAEIKRLQTELALSKPLYSRRQIEARVKLLEAALKPVAEKYDSIIPDAADVAEGFATHPDNMQDDQLALITLRIGDLRRAKALASTGGEHHGN